MSKGEDFHLDERLVAPRREGHKGLRPEPEVHQPDFRDVRVGVVDADVARAAHELTVRVGSKREHLLSGLVLSVLETCVGVKCLMVLGAGFRVQVLWFRVWGSGFGV